ncbi:MAG: hypothetical protein VX259_02280, partial [Pseudomonadota bacterium]|nr:hypothetical protein [Pseudomonadota bacterium]
LSSIKIMLAPESKFGFTHRDEPHKNAASWAALLLSRHPVGWHGVFRPLQLKGRHHCWRSRDVVGFIFIMGL